MDAAVRLCDAANAKTKMENGFDLTNYDERAGFAEDYSNQLLLLDVNLDTTGNARCSLGTVRQILPSGRSKYQRDGSAGTGLLDDSGRIYGKNRLIVNC